MLVRAAAPAFRCCQLVHYAICGRESFLDVLGCYNKQVVFNKICGRVSRAAFRLAEATFQQARVAFKLARATFKLARATFKVARATFEFSRVAFRLARATFQHFR